MADPSKNGLPVVKGTAQRGEGFERSAFNIRRSTFGVQRSAFNVRHSAFGGATLGVRRQTTLQAKRPAMPGQKIEQSGTLLPTPSVER
jgi:hypothetical protein